MNLIAVKEPLEKAIKSKHWKWTGGMRVYFPETKSYIRIPDGEYEDLPGGLPDVSDPATVGCLLSLVRLAYKDNSIYVRMGEGKAMDDLYAIPRWEVKGRACNAWGYPLEGLALIDALEGAP
jgi:hypothetical protein